MATIEDFRGFEEAVADAGTLSNGTFVTSPVRSGGRALSLVAGVGQTAYYQAGLSNQTMVQSVYIRFPSFAASSHGLVSTVVSDPVQVGVYYHQPSNRFALSDGTTFTDFGPTSLSVDTWYRIDFKQVITGTSWALAARADGGTEATANFSTTFVDIGVYLGHSLANIPFSAYFDDWIQSFTAGDYPLGEYKVLGYSPNGVGTHNLDASPSQYFFSDTVGAITSSETTSYQDIDDVPLDADEQNVYVQGVTNLTYADPNGNGTNTAWTGDYTGIDDAVRDPTNAQTSGDGATISSGTANALEDTAFSNPTYVAGATYTLKIFSGSGAKRGLSVSVNAGSSFATVHGANAATVWRNVDVTSQITDQATLDAFTVRWRCDQTAGGGGAGTVTIYAAYLEIRAITNPQNTQYLEYTFADSQESIAPSAVRAIVAVMENAAATSSSSAKLRANSNDGAIYTNVDIPATLTYYSAVFATTPGGAAWTTTIFNGASLRWGYSNDADGSPGLHSAMLEAAFSISLTPVSNTYINPYEAVVKLAPATALSFEAARNLASTYLKPYEALPKIITTAQIPLENLFGVRRLDNIFWWESRGWTTVTPVLPYEGITRLASQYLKSYENLQALASSNTEAWEALTGLSSTGGLPEESLQSISATSIEPYEGLIQIGNTWINPWEAEAVVSFKQTGVARLSLEPGGTPQTRTLHYIAVRARITNAAEVGTLRLRLYEGATPIGAELETVPLTDSFATYLLQIPDADAEDITDYSNLEIRMYGYASTGDSADYEVAEVWLQIPIAGTFLQVTYDTPYEALKGISALADSPYESVIRLTAISVESYENLQGIASTQEEPYEALTGLSAIFDDPMESVQPISQTVTTPYENLQGIAALMGIPYSSLVGLSAANSLPWEAMQPQGVIASFELAYEALGSFATQRQLSWESLVTGITQTFVTPYENLLGLQSLFGTPYDALGAVSQTAPINWESLQGISLASLLAHEALQVLSTMAQVSYESTLPVSSSYVEPYEALAALSQSTGIPYEALVGLSSSTSLPWEGMSISGVLSTYEIAYEALQRLSATIGIPEESLQALQSTAQTAYESLVGLSTQSLLPWEASEITGLAAQYQIPWEAIGSLLATTNVPYETVQYIVSTATSPYEALLGIARLDGLWWDALGSFTSSTAIPYEARGWITNDLVLSYEALQALSATTEIPLEALIRLSLTGQLSWESLSQLVEEHILEGVLFSHLYGRLFRHVDGHAMTHLATEPKQHVSGVLFQPTTTRLRRFR